MSLKQQQEELRQQLKEALEAENATNEQETDEDLDEASGEADASEDDATDAKADDAKVDDKKADAEDGEKSAEDRTKEENSRFARLRMEAKRERERASALEARLNALENSNKEPDKKADVDPEPDGSNETVHLKWQLRQTEKRLADVANTVAKQYEITEEQRMFKGAARELDGYVQAYKPKVKDFDEVESFAKNALAYSFKALGLKGDALGDAVNKQILAMAGMAVSEGLDPAEELYHWAKTELGYQAPAKKADEGKEETKTADMAKVAANRARNAGTAGAKGAGRDNVLSRHAVGDMTTADIMRMSKTERERWLRSLHDN